MWVTIPGYRFVWCSVAASYGLSIKTVTLCIPDRRSNNLIEDLRNLIDDARIGLMPGADETYRDTDARGSARTRTLSDASRLTAKEPALAC
jgi:hypothetical protein